MWTNNIRVSFHTLTFSQKWKYSGTQCDALFLKPENGGIELGKAIKSIMPDITIVLVSCTCDSVLAGYTIPAYRYITYPRTASFWRTFITNLIEDIMVKQGLLPFQLDEPPYEIFASDVTHIQSDGNMVCLNYLDYSKHYVQKRLCEVQISLERYDFVRVHKRYLVNAGQIEIIKGRDIHLVNSITLTVPKARIEYVRSTMAKHYDITV